MEFLQVIEYQTSKPDEVQALGEAYRQKRLADDDGSQAPGQVLFGKDRDRDNVYLTIVRFPSAEVAMENSQREDTGELAAQMAALCDGSPTFRNIDLTVEWKA